MAGGECGVRGEKLAASDERRGVADLSELGCGDRPSKVRPTALCRHQRAWGAIAHLRGHSTTSRQSSALGQ